MCVQFIKFFWPIVLLRSVLLCHIFFYYYAMLMENQSYFFSFSLWNVHILKLQFRFSYFRFVVS